MATRRQTDDHRADAAGETPERAARTVAPRVDIYETEKAFVLLADMPGVAPDGLDVVAERDELIIRGRVEPPATTPDYQEFELANYYRAFMLTEDLDTDGHQRRAPRRRAAGRDPQVAAVAAEEDPGPDGIDQEGTPWASWTRSAHSCRGGASAGEPPAGAPSALALRDDLDRWLRASHRRARGVSHARRARVDAVRWTCSETDDELSSPSRSRDSSATTSTSDHARGPDHPRREARGEGGQAEGRPYVAERRYGGFVRTVPLPPGLDLDRAEARVKRGVLTVTFPKVDARPGTRHIPIKT